MSWSSWNHFPRLPSWWSNDNIEIWKKPLAENKGKYFADAILNRIGASKFPFITRMLGLKTPADVRDIWLHKNPGAITNEKTFSIPKHGIIVLKVHRH